MSTNQPSPRRRLEPSELTNCLVEVERHLATEGWDQPPRLFALVAASDFAQAQPEVAAEAGIPAESAGYVPVEQEALTSDQPIDEVLAGIFWPDAVSGCVLAIERLVLPPSAEDELPVGSPDEVVAAAQQHPERQDIRMVIGVLRNGERGCAVRVRGYEDETDLSLDPDTAPGLVAALMATLEP